MPIPKDGSDSLRYTATPRLTSGPISSKATKSSISCEPDLVARLPSLRTARYLCLLLAERFVQTSFEQCESRRQLVDDNEDTRACFWNLDQSNRRRLFVHRVHFRRLAIVVVVAVLQSCPFPNLWLGGSSSLWLDVCLRLP